MNKKIFALIAIASILAIGLLAGCSVSGGVTLGDSGEVEYSGKTVTVKLASNPTTGYEWSYSIDGTSLKNTGEKYTDTVTVNTNAVGMSGTQTYTFEGTGQGESTITLKYARSWESSDSDTTCKITVTTDSSGKVSKMSAETFEDGSYTNSTSSISS